MIKAVIFDLDGVIADSEPLSGRATDMVLGKYGIRLTPDEKLRAFGRRSPDIFSDALRARRMDGDIRRMVSEKDEILISLISRGLRKICNSVEAVEQLRRKGLLVALATSSHREKMEMELKQLGIEEMFPVKVNGDEVSRGKPDPEIFLKAAQRLGVKPPECAVVEDSTFGVMAAKAAGMLAIGFDSPNSPGQDLSPADHVLSDLSGLLGLLSPKN